MAASKSPDPIDVQVGSRIRIRRNSLKMSQAVLADHLSLTFQQVQKYERGANRVSASMLVKVARKLETTVSVLVGDEGGVELPISDLVNLSKTGSANLLNYYVLMAPETQRAFVGLAAAMVRQSERKN